jgi:limonene-1,2-epoxide hydrolase
VSARPEEEVSEDERQYEDGSDPRVLDVIDVPLIEARPRYYQQENWLLDPQQNWRLVDRVNWQQVLQMVENPDRLWVNEYSTYHGVNDQISLATAQTLRTSLVLIHVAALNLRVLRPRANFGDRRLRVQGQFEHRGERYRLWVTDPGIERAYKARGEGEYAFGECCLTVSLGEAYEGNCYKLIAAMIPRT